MKSNLWQASDISYHVNEQIQDAGDLPLMIQKVTTEAENMHKHILNQDPILTERMKSIQGRICRNWQVQAKSVKLNL